MAYHNNLNPKTLHFKHICEVLMRTIFSAKTLDIVFSRKAIFIYSSFLFICLPRLFGNLTFLLLSIIIAVILFFCDRFRVFGENRFFNTAIFFYAIWIIISFLMHYSALSLIDPLSYINANKFNVYKGLESLNNITILYLFFPLLLFILVHLTRSIKDLHKCICLIPVLFLPSTIVALYQAFIDPNFQNPNRVFIAGTNRAFIAGLNTDGSAFGISLFFLFSLCVLGFLVYRSLWMRLLFSILTFIQLWCLLLRGQHTTLIGILLFCIAFPFMYIWVHDQKPRSLKIKFVLTFYSLTLLIFSVGILALQNYSSNSFVMSRYINGHIQNFKEGGLNLVVEKLERFRIQYGAHAVGATLSAPISGWGPAGFHIIMPDIIFKKKAEPLPDHNAANHYLQMSSELGLTGCFLNIFLHLIPLWMIFRMQNQIKCEDIRWAVAIIFSTLIIFMFIYLTGPHGMAKDVLWIIVALNTFLYLTARKHGYQFRISSTKVMTVSLLVLTAVFFWGTYTVSYGKKGYRAKQLADWWPLKGQYGFYSFEDWKGEKMRWTMQKAKMHLKATSNIFGFKMVSKSPDSQDALNVKIYLNGELLDETHFMSRGMRPFYYYSPSIYNKKVELEIDVSNTFNPRKIGLSSDSRDLGVAMSPVSFLKIMPKEGLGFHEFERWSGEPWDGWPADEPLDFRWTRKRATFSPNKEKGESSTVYLMCAHPDVQDNPVSVKLIGSNGAFDKALFDKAGEVIQVRITNEQVNAIDKMTVIVNRTWNPKATNISADDRDLGVALAVRVDGSDDSDD
jgi:hypothetical protein